MKYIFLALFLSLASYSKAQTFTYNFLGEDFARYRGVLLKVNKSETYSDFSYLFYGDLTNLKTEYDGDVLYPDPKHTYNTVKDSLINKTFKVENIVDKEGNSIERMELLDKPIMVLVDTLTKETIYFKYDPEHESSFPFLTSPIKLDESQLCGRIDRTVDEFTGEIKLNSPYDHNGKMSNVGLMKHIRKGVPVYYLSLSTEGSTVNVNERGAVILFTDGTKLSKAVEIDVEAGTGGFEYSAFMTLTTADLTTLSNKKIKKFRLFIYDQDVEPYEAEKIRAYVKCLKKAK